MGGVIGLSRLPGWRKRYETFIDQVKASPFDWESHECAVAYAGGMVLALTGEDLVAPWRGRFKTRSGALRLLRETGFANLGDLVASLLDEHEHPSRMRVGDIVGIPTDSPFGFSLGICNGGGTILVLREDGMGVLDQGEASRAWRVG
jgi:hypothetical protein